MSKRPFYFSPFIFLIHILILGAGVIACQKDRKAAPLPPEVRTYLYAYTSGVISKVSPIKVQFSQPIAGAVAGEEAPAGLIRFSPDIAGSARWENDRTLRFDPDEPMASGTVYIATVYLKKIIPEVPSTARSFEFDFQTRGQFIELRVDGLYAASTDDLSRQQLEGRLYTADFAESSGVEAILEAVQDDRTLDITWSHSSDQQQHLFTVQEIERKETPSSITLRWNGQHIGAGQQGERSVEIPALGDFRVTGARVVPEQTPYLIAHFSDPLQATQEIEGLVDIRGYEGSIRYLIDGQELRIYPAQRVSGELKIVFNPGIRNIQGRRMANASEWSLTVQDVKPEVRLVGQGVILPNSEGLVFPFEVIGLQAVDVEVFKIFNNNILQFLQSNQLDGSSQLREVGRIMLQTKVDLRQLSPEASTGEWTRYALDLNNLLQQDPEAIYQIRIGFRPAYANYFCGETTPVRQTMEALQVAAPFRETDAEPQSIMDSWYGPEGYYNGYQWEQREDPCYPAYYNSSRFVSRNVFSSNLGLIAKSGKDNQYTVIVTDLRTTAPAAGTAITFYDYQQQVLGTATTGSDGIASMELERPPFVAVAQSGDQKGYLRLQDGDAISISQFDVSGAEPQKGLKGYLYADRGVWRPGDSVFLNFVLDDRYDKLPDNYPVTFELQDPRGTLQERRTTSQSVEGIYPLHFVTAPTAPTGNWIARVKAGGATFDRIIKIETVKPNRLSIDLQFEGDALYADQEPIDFDLTVNWLHGAPARGIRTEVEVDLEAAASHFDGFPNYIFEDPAREINYEPRTIFDNRLDQNGRATFEAEIFNQQMAPGQLTANFRTRAFEPSGEFSTDYRSAPYHPYQAYAGIHLPENEWGESAVAVNQNAMVEFAVADPSGNPLPNRRLSVGVYRVDWRWWWESGRDNISRYNSSNHYNAINTAVQLSTNAEGKVSWTTSFDQWGRYLVRVCDTESGHCSGDFLYAGSPRMAEGTADRQAAAMLNFKADKDQYEVGETVTLTIPTGREGRALISLENGTKVLQSFWSEAQEGENTFTFKTTAEMTPTVYAHVSLLQPHGQVQNDLPIRLYGVIPIDVEDPATVLHPQLDMPDELKPEQRFTVEVSEEAGRPMAYTLAIVDEGLLSLTRFQTPDPHAAIYAREALGVRTWDVYDQVLGARGEHLEQVLSVGGDAAVQPTAEDQRANRFEPVVRHLGPFYLESGQRARHQIEMPNYVGAVRAMVVAAHRGAYGSAEKRVAVKQPLMVLATLPRQLGPGEEVRLPVMVFAMDDKVREAQIEVEENSGLVRWTGPKSKGISFDKPGEGLVTFDFETAARTGVARFTILAASNGERARQSIEIQVRNPNPVQTQVYAEVVDPNQEWTPAFQAIGMAGTNEATLEVSSLPPLNLGQRLPFLLTYPYGCVEQTTSSGFPQLYVHRLLNLEASQKEQAAENVRATIGRMLEFQTGQGGFAYWPGGESADQWSTSYGGHFLLEAREMGYAIPPGLLDRWIDFQQKAARLWTPQLSQYGFEDAGSNQLNQAYRLYTLALAKSPDMAAMNRLRETAGLSKQARWRLAAAYALSGKTEVAQGLVADQSTDVGEYRELSQTYGSRLRDRAMIMETLLLLDQEEQAAQLLQYISDELSSEQWLSTQSVAYALLAVSKFIGEDQVADSFQFTYQLNGQAAVDAGSSNPVIQVALPVTGGENYSLRVKNTSSAKLFTRVIVRGKPVAGAEAAISRDLRLAVRYKNKEGTPIDPSRLLQGADFIAEVQVTHPGTRPFLFEELALNHVFPSGWEILSTRIAEFEEDAPGSPYEYQDIRDDRVNTFFDLPEGQSRIYRIQLNAAYEGRFYLPAISCEAMYDHSIYAQEPGRWVEVAGVGNVQ
jgi:uncharacterized protein YfaS (alpha-2-macroglobulin family)